MYVDKLQNITFIDTNVSTMAVTENYYEAAITGTYDPSNIDSITVQWLDASPYALPASYVLPFDKIDDYNYYKFGVWGVGPYDDPDFNAYPIEIAISPTRIYIASSSDFSYIKITATKAVSVEKYARLGLPEAPAADGSYILQTTVTNGTPTYTWVSLASLSGVTF